MSYPKYKAITLANFEELPQVRALPPGSRKAIRVVGSVLPFKSNNYCVEKLIDWKNFENDPIFTLTFPRKEMLAPEDYARMESLIDAGAAPEKLKAAADAIRRTLNPHPAGQLEHNRPVHESAHLDGMQHKYRETVLFFPSQGQTCHAYCTFCFRWAQFVGMEGLKFATREAALLGEYLAARPYVTDILITGGDPLIMKTEFLEAYFEEILKVKSLRTIRIGSKALAYWPYRLLKAGKLMNLLRRAIDGGRHVAFMAHFNHHVELSTSEVQEAVSAIRSSGAQIRAQSPVLSHINDSPEVWEKMWRKQVAMGMIPYYFFIARNTGASRFFDLPLARALEIFQNAYRRVGGLARTVRGPSMSALPGKVQIVGTAEIKGEKVFVLNFLQSRNPDWTGRPFFAKYDPAAAWLTELKPAFGEHCFFYEQELKRMLGGNSGWAPGRPEYPEAGPHVRA